MPFYGTRSKERYLPEVTMLSFLYQVLIDVFEMAWQEKLRTLEGFYFINSLEARTSGIDISLMRRSRVT